MSKMNIAVIFGSRSCEHDVSIISALQLIEAAKSAMITPGWEFEFWSPIAVASIIAVVLYVVGQNLGDASDPRTHM